jgi:hypothetical protein
LALPAPEAWGEGALNALLATGVPPWAARVALVEAGMDPGAIPGLRGVPHSAVRAYANVPQAIDAFSGVAKTDPVGANAALNAYLALVEGPIPEDLNLQGRWVNTLPDGLAVEGDLRLTHTAIRVLPRNLTVGRFLDLADSQVVTLGPGLTVGGCLHTKHSRTWDGHIPKDASVTIYCFTPVHPKGVRLAYWHRKHPTGCEYPPNAKGATP